MMVALMTSRKSPSVKTVMGSVRNTSRGFTKIFSRISTVATKTAENMSRTSTPGMSVAIRKTANDMISSLVIKRMG